MRSFTTETVHLEYSDAGACCSDSYLVPTVKRFIDLLPSRSRIVDLGCGNASMLRSVMRADLLAWGIDASPSGIHVAVETMPEASFYTADIAGTLPEELELCSFDAVLSTETIEHVTKPRAVVRNAFDLLRPGGAFLVSTPYNGYLKNILLSLTNSMDTHFTALWDGGHIKFWSRKTLTALLIEAGFEQITFEGVGRVPFIWKSMIIIARRPLKTR
jgi:2-polyprenyl-3-methyl-5-hydroxy-6-metoxy-1,4-benzoquinol methylase